MTDSKTAAPKGPNQDDRPASPTAGELVPGIDMEHYRNTVPLWKRVWQHSLTQMMLLSIQAFCGPAMSDAIAGMFATRDKTRVTTDRVILQQASAVVVLQRPKYPTSQTPSTTPCLQSFASWAGHW